MFVVAFVGLVAILEALLVVSLGFRARRAPSSIRTGAILTATLAAGAILGTLMPGPLVGRLMREATGHGLVVLAFLVALVTGLAAGAARELAEGG